MNIPHKFFIDSSFFIAFLNSKETNHQSALNTMISIGPSTKLYTSDYILDECVTRIRSHRGMEIAHSVGEEILNSKKYELIFIDRDICTKALEKLKKFSDKILSFTDCTSFVVMEQMGITHALAFDDDFNKVGFQTLP